MKRSLVFLCVLLVAAACSTDDTSKKTDSGSKVDSKPAPDVATDPDIVEKDNSLPPDAPAPDALGPDITPDIASDIGPDIAPDVLADAEPDVAMCGKIACDCTLAGQQLWGKVKFVTYASQADFKIQVVTSFPDLKVQKVTSLPLKCGQWQILEGAGFPDFTVMEVTSFPDFKIEYVNNFPGLP